MSLSKLKSHRQQAKSTEWAVEYNATFDEHTNHVVGFALQPVQSEFKTVFDL